MKNPREKPSTSQMLTYNPVKKIVKLRPSQAWPGQYFKSEWEEIIASIIYTIQLYIHIC